MILNIFVFYLYDALTKFFEEKIEKTMLKEQNKYYKKQLGIMNTTNENTRAFNHDLANHLAIVRGYIQINEDEKACNYIDKMTKSVYTVKEFSNSGNIDIDSILNHKLYEASKKEIAISLEVKVPISINIASFDIVVILGNLLDNAIEATSKSENDKWIDIIIIYKEEILFINIKNTFIGSVYYEKDKIQTSKKDIENHGIGLNNIEKILKRYDGVMDIDHDDNEFEVEITMYID
ncbi:MAG: sensor histidine kinase [Tissierella sp.]|uniref:sensor histidine kinase n=1 Tax=Tissierella sp. TaxID=41274 RepID=UPI003F999CA6